MQRCRHHCILVLGIFSIRVGGTLIILLLHLQSLTPHLVLLHFPQLDIILDVERTALQRHHVPAPFPGDAARRSTFSSRGS